MSRLCPDCGATRAPEARYCRRCGAPFRVTEGHERESSVSPVAQTVPLAEEGRATNGLPAEESQRLGEGTSRLKRTEVDDLLRRVAREHGTGDRQINSATPARLDGQQPTPQSPPSPLTATLQTPAADDEDTIASSSSSSSSAPTAAAKVAKRARTASRRWQWAAIILLCVAVTAALLAFLSSRSAKTSDASVPAPVPAGEERPQEATAETGALSIEPVTIETPPPLNTPPPPPPERTRDGEAAAHPAAPQAPATRTASPAPPTPSPPGGQTTTTAAPPPAATAPALSATDHYQRGVQMWERDRRSALEEFRAAVPGVPDAYFYLGSEYYSDGRDPKSLNDGELRAALNYFLRATGGPHSNQANKYAQQLGKEYERRKKQSRR